MKRFIFLCLAVALSLLAACSTLIESTANPVPLDAQATWAVLPVANHTDTPQAGLTAEDLIEHQLHKHGIGKLLRYPAALSRDSLFEPTERKVVEEAQQWARQQGVRFAVLGSVQEWRYKVGIDGEPAAGMTIQVLDLSTQQVVWSASSAMSGWSRQALSAVGQALVTQMLAGLPLQPVPAATARP